MAVQRRDGRLEDRPGPARSPLELHAGRLHYFMDLLETGYRHALLPEPLPLSLRAERIALGIDLPELDTVPLWSVRRADGAVAIPFVLGDIFLSRDLLEEVCGGRGILGAIAGQCEALLAVGSARPGH